MNRIKFLIVLSVVGILAFTLVACGGGQAEPAAEQPAQNQPAAEAPAAGVEATTVAVAEAPASDVGPLVPEDIPIMDGGRDIEVSSSQLSVAYTVDDREIADVVAFYDAELPNHGWEQGRTPDSSVGSMAAMARENERGDRVTFSMQANPIGGFVVIRITITRAP